MGRNLHAWSRRWSAHLTSQPPDGGWAGTAARDRFPTLFPSSTTTTTRSTPFCRNCLSNQALQLHLLASYPLDESSPSSDDSSARPSHESEIDPYPPLDEYRRSLDLRYPLVCAECAPAVESTIRERDYRVKAQALGWRLRETQRRREEEEKRSDEARRREGRNWVVQGAVWRLRGVTWASTHVAAIAAACSGARSRQFSGALHLTIHASLLASNSLWHYTQTTSDRLNPCALSSNAKSVLHCQSAHGTSSSSSSSRSSPSSGPSGTRPGTPRGSNELEDEILSCGIGGPTS